MHYFPEKQQFFHIHSPKSKPSLLYFEYFLSTGYVGFSVSLNASLERRLADVARRWRDQLYCCNSAAVCSFQTLVVQSFDCPAVYTLCGAVSLSGSHQHRHIKYNRRPSFLGKKNITFQRRWVKTSCPTTNGRFQHVAAKAMTNKN